MSNFIHLRSSSNLSVTHGLPSIKQYAKSASAMGYKAFGLMDDMNMFGFVKAYKTMPGSGVKPILGTDLLIHEDGVSSYRVGVICQNEKGYKNLCKLVSRAYEEGYVDGIPHVKREWIQELSEGLIGLSGGVHGDVGKCLLNDKNQHAERRAQWWSQVFDGKFFIELQRVGRDEDEYYVNAAVKMAEDLGLPVVATNDVQFEKQSDFIAHKIRNAIPEKVTLQKYQSTDILESRYTPHQYLKTEEEMVSLWDDVPTATSNTVAIAQMCTFDIELGKNYLPAFPTEGDMPEAEYLEKVTREGLEARLELILDKDDPDYAEKRKEYDDRLDFELKIINEMGFPGYFLIVAEFIQWSKDNDIPVGPGRGSGAGSLVAYALKITDLDPIHFDLLFERFLNPERVSMPDFDVDFCKDGRDKVIKHVADKYGHKAVSQIVTFGTMSTKAVIGDVARVLGKPFTFSLGLRKKVPDQLGITLSECLEDETFRLEYEVNPEAREVIDEALKLEGAVRGTGMHAGGVVIAPGQLTDFSATMSDEDGSGFVTQYDKNDVEDVGLVKFDFLGLKTLTVTNRALKDINKRRESEGKEPVNIDLIDLNDKHVFDKILGAAKTTAVFQLESAGMKELIHRLKPTTFDDIIALVALYRPGPMQAGMVDTYVECKNGIRAVELLHKDLGDVLGNTYGVLIYQEQVMQTAQVLAGYTLGGADMLRRAMGKKKPEEMEKQRGIFVDGCVSQGYDAKEAGGIFDSIEKFAGYGFNKSHSAAYALVSYQTAWLKTYYPEEFMSSVLTQDQNDLEKVVFFVNECKDMGIKVLPPDINTSTERFTSTKEGEINFSMTAVKGLGMKQVENILREREENGPFEDLYDFILRTNANKKTIVAGINAGLFDSFGFNRATLLASYEDIQAIGKKLKERAKRIEKKTGNSDAQMDIFGDALEEKYAGYTITDDIPLSEVLSGERATLGMYISGHPLNEYENEIKHVITGKLSEMMELQVDDGDGQNEQGEIVKRRRRDKSAFIVGVIVSADFKKTSRGDNMAILMIDDGTSQVETAILGEDFDRLRHMMRPDELICIEGNLRWKESIEKFSLGSRKARSMDEMRAEKVSHIKLNLANELNTENTVNHIKEIARNASRGPCKIEIQRGDSETSGILPHSFSMTLKESNINSLREYLGRDNVRVVYKSEKEAASKVVDESIVLVDPEEKKKRELARKAEWDALEREALDSFVR